MAKSLKGKVALVTGGSRGIGAAIALALAEEGADVVISYASSAAKADTIVDELKSKGVRAQAFEADQANEREVEDLVKKVAQQFGATRHIVAFHGRFLLVDVVPERLDLGGGDIAHKGTGHFRFQHAPHRKHLPGFGHRGCGHKGAAGGLQANQAVLRQLKQRLPHQGARHTEMIGQFLFGQFGARVQPVLHNGFGQGFDDGMGGG